MARCRRNELKPAPFAYDAPRHLEEALALLAEHSSDALVLAGGQSLVPMLNLRLVRPRRLVDVNQLHDLAYLRAEAGTLRIGALTRQATLEQSAAVARHWRLLRDAVRHAGHPATRNRGTVGGSVAHADRAAELPAALTALDARFHVRSQDGSRTLTAEELFVTHLTTSMRPDELLVEIEVPEPAGGSRHGFAELAATRGAPAWAGAAVVVGPGRAAVALLGVADTPVRARAAEQALAEGASARAAGALAAADVEGDHRRALIAELVRRAVENAG